MDEQPGKRRPRYLGFVAHEIKNPLATALWSCDLLKRMDAADRASARGEKMADASLRALRKMRRLVDDFFTIERLREHVLDLRVETVDLRSLVDSAITHLKEKDALPAESWTVDVPGDVAVKCDAELMRRALRAVLEDSIRVAQAEHVAITAHRGQGATTLLVKPRDPKGPVLPAIPEERNASDPHGAVLGFTMAEAVLRAHGGGIELKDGALALSLPA
jgi:K+-sensing histidine kinase KdpD